MKFNISIVSAMIAATLCCSSARADFFGFEGSPTGLEFINNAGLDRGAGLAFGGQNNVWANASDQRFHGVMQRVRTYSGNCNLKVALFKSLHVTNLYISVIDPQSGHIYAESGPYRGDGYRAIHGEAWHTEAPPTLAFRAGPWLPANSQVGVRIGFWANGKSAYFRADSLQWDCQPSSPPQRPVNPPPVNQPRGVRWDYQCACQNGAAWVTENRSACGPAGVPGLGLTNCGQSFCTLVGGPWANGSC